MAGGRVKQCLVALLIAFGLAAGGCQSLTWRGQEPEPQGPPSARQDAVPFVEKIPSEMNKTTLPTYIIEPPDILNIEATKLVPKAPYHFEQLDVIQVLVTGTLPDQPISGQYQIDSGGTIDLGPAYGKVQVAGMTAEEAKQAIVEVLKNTLANPEVAVSLVQATGQQQIVGEHLVAPDGTISLGSYGRVYVAGLSVIEASTAVEKQLQKYLELPRISLDVFTYNSKFYYIISEGAGLANDAIVRAPITGNETVIDALSLINGRTRLNSKNIWIARPAPGGVGCDQILPVNWNEITKGAATATNYQIFPGDRIFIAEDKLVALDAFIGRVTAPAERIFGSLLLQVQTIQLVNRLPNGLPSQ